MKTGKTGPQLPKYNDGIAAALLGAREAVMSPIRPILREHSLTEQQWRLLRVLIDIGAMEISKAAEASMIMGPSVTRIIKDMTRRNLIRKTNDTRDARRSILSITPTGRAVVRKTAKQTATLLALYKREFGDQRFEALLAELKYFQTRIRQINNPENPERSEG